MSIGISDKQSQLAALLQHSTADPLDAAVAGRDATVFNRKLDTALAGTETNSAGRLVNAQALAESLKLQMLHTTLSLSGDPQTEHQSGAPFSTIPSLRAMLDSYRANQAEQTVSPTPEPTPVQPLPDAVAPANATSSEGPRSPGWLDPIISKASQRYGIDVSLIKAVIKTESNFNPKAVSSAGARGLMQLMPATARNLGVNDSFDPEQNVMAGTRFLKNLLDRYNGDLDSALAAYNWGPGNVDKHPGRLPRETRSYLVRIKQLLASSVA